MGQQKGKGHAAQAGQAEAPQATVATEDHAAETRQGGAGADGVHLPSAGVSPADARRLLGAGRLVGVSCHSAEDVARALAGGADLATFGPLFETPSKRAYGAPVGLERLAEAARLGLPLFGLGGVNLSNASAVVDAGAAGLAAIRAWLEADDPASVVKALLHAVERGTR